MGKVHHAVTPSWLSRAAVWLLLWSLLLNVGLPLPGLSGPASPAGREGWTEGVGSSGELIVRFQEWVSEAEVLAALRARGVWVAGTLPGGPWLVQVDARTGPAAVLGWLQRDPRVKYAEPNLRLKGLEQGIVRDPSAAEPHPGEPWPLAAVEASAAWLRAAQAAAARGRAPSPVTVALIDTQVDASHADLTGRVLPGLGVISGTGDAGDAVSAAAAGHGTHVAGIIAGAAGPLPVTILPIQALNAAAEGTVFDVAQGIRRAVDWRGPEGQRVRVVNLSLGERLREYPHSLAEAVEYALAQGVLVVAAAGNDGRPIRDGGESAAAVPYYPAALNGVLAVGASGRDHRPLAASNSGAHLLAPGVGIRSALPGNVYGVRTGTSFAAPLVASAAALLWSAYPDSSMEEVAAALQAGQREIAGAGPVLSMDLALVWLGAHGEQSRVQVLEAPAAPDPGEPELAVSDGIGEPAAAPRGRVLAAAQAAAAGGARISAGERHSLLLKPDGTVWAWGGNDLGQLGAETFGWGNLLVPTHAWRLTGPSTAVAAGGKHSLALLADGGTVKAWGSGGSGQLGYGGNIARTANPTEPSGLADVVGLAASRYHSMAVRADGTVWTWGNNAHGQLGDGTQTMRTTPVQVGAPEGEAGYLTDVQAIAAGYYPSVLKAATPWP